MKKILLCVLFMFAARAVHAQTVTFIRLDSSTGSNWTGKYGSTGYSIPLGANILPAGITVAPSTALTYQWAPGFTCWYNPANFTIDTDITTGSYQVALWIMDYDDKGRTETIQALSGATATVLSSQTISNFQNGDYLLFTVSGNVTFKIITSGGPNAVIDGVFFDPVPSTGSTTSTGSTSSTGGTGGFGTGTASCPTPKVIISTTVMAGAQSYQFYRAGKSGGPYVQLATSVSTTFTDTTVSLGNSYYYVTTDTSSTGVSGYSPEIAVSIPAQ